MTNSRNSSESLHFPQDEFRNNPIIYHLITDRFQKCVGGRTTCFEPWTTELEAIGHFHGGMFSGITRKLEEGWFCNLGINALLISAPYQQILGWVPGAEASFKHYGYHGYYALDFTVIDDRLGTESDFATLIKTAHQRGIRVLLDVVLNHAGYPDLHTMNVLGLPALRLGWQDATPLNYSEFLDDSNGALLDWWGPSWVRARLDGYEPGGADELTMLVHELPDFKTEDRKSVRLPAFFEKLDYSRAREFEGACVRQYLISWLTGWVKRFGIDGFRCDSARHVELDAWHDLKIAGSEALSQWRSNQNTGPQHYEQFFMLGEVYGHGIAASDYYEFGFDSLLNFSFQEDLLNNRSLDSIYASYAAAIAGNTRVNPMSYISSHDTGLYPRSDLYMAVTALLLCPGGILMFYGDETGRPPGPHTPADPAQASRCNMNWESVDAVLHQHCMRLGQFRRRHISLSLGLHSCLSDSPYVFTRVDLSTGDRVVVVFELNGELRIQLSDLYENGTFLHDAYHDRTYEVKSGAVIVYGLGPVLLELK